ncbi:MAG: ATP-binding protein [Spirochaetes bacterium]|nr:ATP-binding protein [Spirochaetota bacterium]
MDFLHHIYFTFFSIGSLIPVLALGYIAYFLIVIPKKSTSTIHLAIGYLLMTIFNFAYFISSSFYHPLAAYHRWITVAVIIPAEIHFNMFMLFYGGFHRRGFAKIFFALQYAISIAITVVFIIKTFTVRKIFHFDGHYWDFDADKLSALIGIIIIFYILIFIAIAIYKVMTLPQKEERRTAIFAGLSYLAATIIPSITNMLSRKGVIDREIFQISWAMCNIFGFFLLAVIYINSTKEKTNFLSQITAISLISIFTLFQALSYISLRDLDRSFHELRLTQSMHAAFMSNFRPTDLLYLAAYNSQTLMNIPQLSWGGYFIDNEPRERILLLKKKYENAPATSLHPFHHFFVDHKGHHRVVYIFSEPNRNAIFEAGFSYESYRKYLHPTSGRYIGLAFFLLIFALIGFRLFFLEIFIRPFKKLTYAVSQVNDGNLTIAIPSSAGHEIGFLTDSFTKMVNSIKKSQDELEETQLYLKNIIDSMPSVLIGVDDQGRITHWNMEAQRITHMREEDVIGKKIDEMVPQMRALLKRIDRSINRKLPQKLEKVTYRINDETRVGDIMIYPLVTNGVRGAVIRVDDITDRVRIEEMMVQSEKMASIGGLAAGMAHEINNPLGGIMLAAQNIMRRLSPEIEKNREAALAVGTDIDTIVRYMQAREIYKMIEGILEMSERATKIVTNMLNFSRRSESKMVPANITELIEKAIELASNDYDLKKKYDFRHIEIQRDYEENLPQIKCIVTEIQQVILNLLKNAAQAMAEKHYGDEKPTITIRIRKETLRIRVEIEDNGPGIPEKIRKRIFEPFFTTKSAGTGTGLGLSVSYFIIHNDHKGTLTVDSEPGKWTRFTIRLPYLNDTPERELILPEEK